MHISAALLLTTLLTFVINLPFGYWRGSARRYSLAWFLAIHIPVPIIIFLRFYLEIGFHWSTYLFLVGAFFTGQYVGGAINKWFKKRRPK
jgi:cytochrome b561